MTATLCWTCWAVALATPCSATARTAAAGVEVTGGTGSAAAATVGPASPETSSATVSATTRSVARLDISSPEHDHLPVPESAPDDCAGAVYRAPATCGGAPRRQCVDRALRCVDN